ncbi:MULTISPECIES: CpsD/CapB family tyrosine-protein kinase [Thiorhodovibrio]|uniref:CpsD/CapB family tyrosine-protein kinase n=1 Tax=Thiorhodovibrio TaxID=61593 RepID=UPI00191447D0|nr:MULTISPECIES: CpsD/CapB family tyrosine-protein kinase [Thiorhodovibrio]MBK5970782.1 exopolysaccharide biosynthesis protein [Thiorhodovibrio winogradskyi]WPL10827.1 Tyrosine-protein kinase YwqD [Thiorhodovibrio litoralis]
MERIKEALERARAERAAARLDDGTELSALQADVQADLQADLQADVQDDEVEEAEDDSSGVQVSYTKTRNLSVNYERLRAKRVLINEARSPIVDAYNILRTRILQRLRPNGWNAVAVTSPRPGCGKTLTCINLAISLAREVNQTVLLVDLDLRRPSVIRYFTDEDLPGVSDYLLEQHELAEILVNPSIERLVILPGHSSFTNSSEMLSTPRMVRLVTELKTRYPDRIVLFDMPPLLTGDDVLAFSPYIDAIMLVVEASGTTRDDLRRAWNLLDGKRILGVVLNKADGGSAGDGYY